MDENEKFREMAESAFNPMEQAMGVEMVELIKQEKAAYIDANMRMTEQHIARDKAQTRIYNNVATLVSVATLAGLATWVAWFIEKVTQ